MNCKKKYDIIILVTALCALPPDTNDERGVKVTSLKNIFDAALVLFNDYVIEPFRHITVKDGVDIILLAFVLYFVGIVANLGEELEFLKYITPFAYADGSAISSAGAIELKYLATGFVLFALGIAAAFVKYGKKDIS